jgi:hypothetical protein
VTCRAHADPRSLGDGWPWTAKQRAHSGIAAELVTAGGRDDEARFV